MALNLYHSQIPRYGNLCHQKLNLPILQKNLKRKLNHGSQKIVRAGSVKPTFILQVSYRRTFETFHFNNCICFDYKYALFIMEMIKMIDVSFFLFWRLFDIIIIIIKDSDGNIERFLAGWKYCNLYYFYTIDFFNLYIFCPIFAPKIMTMF